MWRQVRLWGLVATVLLLAGCGSIPLLGASRQPCQPPSRDSALGSIDGVYVLPFDGREPVLDEIDRATCSIDINIYLLSDDAVIDALVRAEARGVEVRLIYEDAPFGGGVGVVELTEALDDQGVEVRPGPDRFRFMHAKYIVIDDQVAIITNQNLTYSAFESNRELGVITTSNDDVLTLSAIFAADWSDTVHPEPSERLIVSPENARQATLDRIDSAESTVRLYVEVIRDDEVIDALSRAAQRGVSVRLIVNPADDELDSIAYNILVSNGVEVRVARHVYVHAKALVIDERAVVIGSHNPTATSLDENREVSIVLDDRISVSRAVSVFDSDWSESDRWLESGWIPQIAVETGVDMTAVYG